MWSVLLKFVLVLQPRHRREEGKRGRGEEGKRGRGEEGKRGRGEEMVGSLVSSLLREKPRSWGILFAGENLVCWGRDRDRLRDHLGVKPTAAARQAERAEGEAALAVSGEQ